MIRKQIAYFFQFISSGFAFLGNKTYQSLHQQRVHKFKTEFGNQNQLLNLPINNSSIVFDVGGFQGQWASDIYAIYQPTIYIFEPIVEFSNSIAKRFAHNKKIKVLSAGLSNKTIKSTIFLNQDGSSLIKETGTNTKISLIGASEFIHKNNIKNIDLMKLNIEGAEYDVLEDLTNNKLLSKIHYFQIQFHEFVPDAQKRYKKITNELKKTHKMIYHYPFVWEAWELKK
jgi:FkbM family methyltransferase